MLTKEQCQRKLFNIGIKLGVAPKLISTRLLSNDDKQDMLNGLIPDETLFVAVQCWMEAGMPDYAHGNTERYKPPPDKPMQRYRGIGKR
ncbi:hypothetical protein UFOVP685_32 [uncultured Caudovirales phage]|uniref:Uncharacterized protein n=1 Tax=uncultured Caudovirales phage TaxID=2100421 RepID=A0A6J5MY05_9CAUD|nr:hypothetical protein UFOVP590_52 [uncultured Caudovirales phage]CAB4157548.1 hypothetical protein UFOVP685_32 [uncultured Caudovirales phage]CAB5225377.1 hypothetical protein UFOVP750_20 [uncultured Caudovirales phage]